MVDGPLALKERLAEQGSPQHHLASAERQAVGRLEQELQRLVERLAAQGAAQQTSLVVLDPTTQALGVVATCSQPGSGPSLANVHVHEEVAHWVTRHQAPAIITDFANDARARALGLFAVGSLLAVPLLSDQQALGALTLSSPAIDAFSPAHLRQLELVADLGALAIVQARQLIAQARQQAHLAQLLEVSRGVGRRPDAGTVVGLTISALRRLIHCEEAVLFRYEAGTQTLCGVAGVGTQSRQLAEAHIRVSDPQSVTAWVAQQQRPLLYASGTQGGNGPATETLLVRRAMALLAVPLLARERLWGVLLLTRAVPFEPAELRTMLTLSQIIAPSLV